MDNSHPPSQLTHMWKKESGEMTSMARSGEGSSDTNSSYSRAEPAGLAFGESRLCTLSSLASGPVLIVRLLFF